ncbi:hypothetical protein WKH86_15680 [Xanthomonas oryzae pv. oryzae]|uniref:Uncharacterized protein n=2 Tax=Xanthomonas oryzae pv. oryzae TaxID=64187 RepID=A0A854CKA6_XANOO|nr:hypothetical protein [Xanthomonas oryzae]AJQ85363.1 hypothetical protein AZ54_02035 [Xanthomonas oryzae pv. oryzae PXO86]ACD57062.1 hypothetical protein PXO_03807 [Xanthomonas oryzae pv. oryzae PXO99A]ALZ70444.1 hypothetical protein APZ20_01845 [Xanthomonas oryzae pv. oryzae]AOS04215.1 hypothetical protein ATY42_21350 [Xanthomonas oryzae pv. oryzae]AOS05115.1 hypothetical protein ATY43_01915 [Xanthomonas oryzae pv. oryzae]
MSTGGDAQDEEHEELADRIAQRMRDAMTLAINPRMRRLLSIVFWMATCVSCSAGVEILFAAH